jgi:hypothetical protein
VRVSITDPSPHDMATSEQPPPVPAPAATTNRSHFSQILHDLGREIDTGEATMRGAVQSMRTGANLGPDGLIALQIGVYQYNEAIDLASRVVDHAVGGVKTVVQAGGQ